MTSREDETERLVGGYTGRIFLLITLAFLAIKTGRRLLPPLLPLIIDVYRISRLRRASR